MAKRSAGVLLYQCESGMISVLLVHPGGPFWWHKDKGAWQIPKGLIAPDETPLAAALRETAEELGTVFSGEAISLGEVQQAGGKYVEAFAINELWNPADLASNSFEIEWPPRSGKRQSFPEVDAARWFSLDEARGMMLKSQQAFVNRLERHIDGLALARTDPL